LVVQLTEEMRLLAVEMGWRHTVLAPSSDPGSSDCDLPELNGISLGLHESAEDLMLFFDSDGTLRDPALLVGREDPELTQLCAIKTQFSPADVHVAVVRLLRHLDQRYFRALHVEDEGQYWQTGDRDLLVANLEFLRQRIEGAAEALSALPGPPASGESAAKLADRIEEALARYHADSSPDVN